MAYIVDYAETYLNAASTSIALNMPAHQTNDLLLVMVTQDANTAITLPAGWTALNSQTSNGTAITAAAAYKVAASGAETATITTTDGWIARVFCVRDAPTSTPISASAFTTTTSSSTPTTTGVSTGTDTDCLALYMLAIDGIAVACHSNPGVMSLGSADNQGSTATTASTIANAWYVQRAAGTTPSVGWTSHLAGVGVAFCVAIKNKSGGALPAYIDDVSSPATTITPCHHFSTLNNISFPAALTATANINGKTTAYVVAAAQADLGINPYSAGLANAASVKAATVLNGFEIALTGNRNWSTGLIMGSLIGATPKMGAFGSGNIAQGGYVVRIGSGASNWCAYQVGAKDAVPNLAQRCVFAIQAGYTGSSYGTPGSAVDTAAVSFIQFLNNTPSFSSNIILSELHQVFKQVIAGGNSVAPVDTAGVVSVGSSFRLPVIQQAGAAGLLSYAPIQIGGGDAVNFQIDAGALQFARRYDTTKKEIAYHAADNAIGISYAGKSGDVIKHTNSLISSPTSFYWEINSAATSAATWDFAGTSIINALVTLRPVMTFQNMSFTDCTSVTTTGSTIQNCKFDNAPILVSSPANAALISNSTITSGGTGHGITITGTAADITLSGLTFSGYETYQVGGTSTGNEAIFVNIGSGTMTISVAGGGTTPSFKTAGAAVTISSGATITVNNLVTGSRVKVTRDDNSNVIFNDTETGGQISFTTSYAGAFTVDVRKASGTPYYKPWVGGGISAIGSTTTVKALQELDE